ncbi:hypothetical protein CBL_07450 [Carabus blaptoides fortunei]
MVTKSQRARVQFSLVRLVYTQVEGMINLDETDDAKAAEYGVTMVTHCSNRQSISTFFKDAIAFASKNSLCTNLALLLLVEVGTPINWSKCSLKLHRELSAKGEAPSSHIRTSNSEERLLLWCVSAVTAVLVETIPVSTLCSNISDKQFNENFARTASIRFYLVNSPSFRKNKELGVLERFTRAGFPWRQGVCSSRSSRAVAGRVVPFAPLPPAGGCRLTSPPPSPFQPPSTSRPVTRSQIVSCMCRRVRGRYCSASSRIDERTSSVAQSSGGGNQEVVVFPVQARRAFRDVPFIPIGWRELLNLITSVE